jgi:hypothetical protein
VAYSFFFAHVSLLSPQKRSQKEISIASVLLVMILSTPPLQAGPSRPKHQFIVVKKNWGILHIGVYLWWRLCLVLLAGT